MDQPKQTRSQAVKALKALINVPRPTEYSTLPEIFPFGFLPPGFDAGKPVRRKWDDRAIVLITGAVLDQALEAAILQKLPGIKKGNEAYVFSDDGAPLRDFDSKIRVGFGLGIYGEGARSDLSLIRSIRNTFAHSRLQLSFESQEVIAACAHFTLPARKPSFVRPSLDAREVFIQTGGAYATYLIPVTQGAEFDPVHDSVLDLPAQPPRPK